MVASCAGAALGCYLVSLRVASERAALEDVETKIVLAQRDIRLLQTEIGTRGRLAQLERWNVKVLRSVGAVGRPVPRRRLPARDARPARSTKLDVEAPVVLASAPAPHAQSAPLEESEPTSGWRAVRRTDGGPADACRRASGSRARAGRRAAATADAASAQACRAGRQAVGESRLASAATTKPVRPPRRSRSPRQKAGDKKAVAAAKPVTKPVRTAKRRPAGAASAGGQLEDKRPRIPAPAR